MAYVSKYYSEFDTIKSKNVRIDIEEEYVTLNNFNYAAFFVNRIPSQGINELIITQFNSKYFVVGNKIQISGTQSNNGIYTIISIYPAGSSSFSIYFTESVTPELVDMPPEVGGLGPTYLKVDLVSLAVVTELTAASQSPLEISYDYGEFDKNVSIRESKLRFKFLNKGIHYDDIVNEWDTQYKIKVTINNNLEWIGYLDSNYLSELFLDTLSELQISANDGLSLLKTRPLRDFSNNEIWGDNSILAYINACLYQTNLNLDIWSFINMYPEGTTIVRSQANILTWFYDAFSLVETKSQTFLNGPRNFEDCYIVLSKIMQAFGCTLMQARGKWYIIQTNDRIKNLLGGTLRTYDGAVVNAIDNANFDINIGLNEVTKLINQDAVVTIEKPFEEVAVTYTYDSPVSYFRNFDLLDTGTFRSELSTATNKYYNLKNWNELYNPVVQRYYNSYGDILTTTKAFIRTDIDIDTGAELSRFLVLKLDKGNPGAARTTEYPVNAGDRIKFEFFTRLTKQYNAFTTVYSICIILRGNNGDTLYLGVQDWYENITATSLWLETNANQQIYSRVAIDEYAAECPIDGYLSFMFVGSPINAPDSVLPIEMHIKDFRVDIAPSLNLNVNASGYEHKSLSSLKNKNKFDIELFLSDSLNISVKGALTSRTGVTVPYPKNNWRHISETDANSTAFSKYIKRAYWRTMYRKFIKIEGRLFNLFQDNRLISPINTVNLTEIDNKQFMITTLRIDIRQEQAEFTMVELRDTSNNNDANEIGTESYRLINVKEKDADDPNKEPKTVDDGRWGYFGELFGLNRKGKIRRYNNHT